MKHLRWERFKRRTVWHPANQFALGRDVWGPKLWLPLYHLFTIAGGVAVGVAGSPMFNRIFAESVIDGASVAFIIGGILAIIGGVFPRLFRLEIIGSLVTAFMMTSYAMLVLSFPPPGGGGAAATAFSCIILLLASWMIYPRLTLLFIHSRRS